MADARASRRVARRALAAHGDRMCRERDVEAAAKVLRQDRARVVRALATMGNRAGPPRRYTPHECRAYIEAWKHAAAWLRAELRAWEREDTDG